LFPKKVPPQFLLPCRCPIAPEVTWRAEVRHVRTAPLANRLARQDSYLIIAAHGLSTAGFTRSLSAWSTSWNGGQSARASSSDPEASARITTTISQFREQLRNDGCGG
jgi:hypothetical protein